MRGSNNRCFFGDGMSSILSVICSLLRALSEFNQKERGGQAVIVDHGRTDILSFMDLVLDGMDTVMVSHLSDPENDV